MDDSTKYRKLKDLGNNQPEPGYAYIVEPDETGRTIAVDGSWGANLPPWAVSTHVEPQYVGSTAAICVDYSRTPNSYDWRTTKPAPLTAWDKLFLFLTGRS